MAVGDRHECRAGPLVQSLDVAPGARKRANVPGRMPGSQQTTPRKRANVPGGCPAPSKQPIQSVKAIVPAAAVTMSMRSVTMVPVPQAVGIATE